MRAPDARTAFATARETAIDLLHVLASTFNGYELVVDVRQVTRRTDAVYQAEGPIPRSTLPRAGSPSTGCSPSTPRRAAPAAAMEVLADADESPLLDKLSDDARAQLHKGLDDLLGGLDLSTDDRNRLANRLLEQVHDVRVEREQRRQ